MATPLHIKLLKELKNQGIGVVHNVSPFMADNFSKPRTRKPVEYNKQVRPPILFLRDLQDRGFIANDGLNDNDLFEPNHAEHWEKPTWYNEDKNETSIYITSQGLDYLDKHKDSYQTRVLNWAIIINIVVTVIFSAIVTGITKSNLDVSKNNLEIAKSSSKSDSITSQKLNERLDSLSHLLRPLRVKLK